MAHGTPDWGININQAVYSLREDLAELAARLSSPVTYDRGGVVVFMEDFSHGLDRWTTGIGGDGDTIDLSTAHTLSGPFSARLVAGSAVTPLAEIAYELPKQVPSGMGGEIAFAIDSETSIIELELCQYDGTGSLHGTVRYSPVDKTLAYRPAAGAYVPIATGVQLLTEAHVFHRMKLVVDLAAEEYVKVLLDDTAHSLAGIPLRTTGLGLAERFDILIWNRGIVGQTCAVYADRVIVTQNEPV